MNALCRCRHPRSDSGTESALRSQDDRRRRPSRAHPNATQAPTRKAIARPSSPRRAEGSSSASDHHAPRVDPARENPTSTTSARRVPPSRGAHRAKQIANAPSTMLFLAIVIRSSAPARPPIAIRTATPASTSERGSVTRLLEIASSGASGFRSAPRATTTGTSGSTRASGAENDPPDSAGRAIRVPPVSTVMAIAAAVTPTMSRSRSTAIHAESVMKASARCTK